MREWEYDRVVWRVGLGELWTACEAPACFKAAEILCDVDDRDRGTPLCLDCAGLLLERQVAVAELPPGTPLPDLWGRDDPPRRRARASSSESWDRTPEKWLAEQGYYGAPIDTSDPDWDIPF